MDRPVPPSNYKTKDGDVREDLRRIRVYLEQLNDWIEDNSGDPNALTAATADLLYLKRAANDFTTFAAKTTPTTADVLLIEDAAASFAKKNATLGQLGFASIYGSGSVPLWVPPAARGLTPDALDDEFDSTTINPAWVFRDMTTGPTNRTPTFGALTEYTVITGAASVPKVSLHTQGRRSWMFVQTTTTGPAAYLIYKPFTWAAGKVYWTRLGHFLRKTGTTPSTGGDGFWIGAVSGGVPDVNNRAFVSMDPGGPYFRWTVVNGGVATTQTILFTEGLGAFPYFAFSNPNGVLGAGSNWNGEVFNDDGQRVLVSNLTAGTFTWTPALIGFQWSQPMLEPNAMAVDFIRASAGHPLLHV